jgi:hypothetical protein
LLDLPVEPKGVIALHTYAAIVLSFYISNNYPLLASYL